MHLAAKDGPMYQAAKGMGGSGRGDEVTDTRWNALATFEGEARHVHGRSRVTRLSIDSRHRNQVPRNIIDTKIVGVRALLFQQGSKVVTVWAPGHGFRANDHVVVSGVEPLAVRLKGTAMELIKDTSYIRINHLDHGITAADGSIYVTVSGVTGTNGAGIQIGTVPINAINRKHRVLLTRDINTEAPNTNYYYIDIGIDIPGSYIPNATPFSVTLSSLHGVPLNELNADFPVNMNHARGYHTVTNADANFCRFEVNTPATSSSTINGGILYIGQTSITAVDAASRDGGTGVHMARIVDTIEGYPSANSYKINLRRTFYNVERLRLVSTEFPNTEKVIKALPADSQNNLLYWQIMLDGDTVYRAELSPGNYDKDSLAAEIVSRVQAVKRVGSNLITSEVLATSTTAYVNQNHSCAAVIDQATSTFKLQMYNEVVLERPLVPSDIDYDDGFQRLQVIHPQHFLNAGDTIVISGASATHNIPAAVLNATFTIESVINSDVYQIKLSRFNPLTNNSNQTFGGTAVSVKSPIEFRLLFNRPGTIGKVLGFKNVGGDNAVTQYGKLITNQTAYEDDTAYTSTGSLDTEENLINLSGESYLLMTSPLFSNSVSTGGIEGAFAKILLAGQPNTVLYNHFVQLQETPPEVITSLSELEFAFRTPDNTLFNFNNQDHSFTLEVHERV